MERKAQWGVDIEATTGEAIVLAVGPFSGTLNVNMTPGPNPDLSQKVDVPFGAVLVQIPLVNHRVRLMVVPLATALHCRPASIQVEAALAFAVRADLQLQHHLQVDLLQQQQFALQQAIQMMVASQKSRELRYDDQSEEKQSESVRYQFLVPSLRAEADDGSVTLTWEPARAIPVSSSGNHTELKPCVQYRLELADPEFGGVILATWEGTVGPSCFKGLTPDHSYMLRIQALGDEGHYLSSVWSDFFACRTLPLIIPILKVTKRQKTSLVLSWEKSSAASSFTLLMYPQAATPPSELVEEEPSAADLFMQSAKEVYYGPLCSYEAQSLREGTPYFFRIRAHNLRSQTPWGPVIKVFSNVTVPSIPAEPIIGIRTCTSIALSWLEPNSNGAAIEKYTLLMDTGSTSFEPKYSGKECSFVVTKLDPGFTYRFSVKATNSEGSSEMSPVASATTLCQPPDAPSAPAIDSKQGRKAFSLFVKWQAPKSRGSAVISYELQIGIKNCKEPEYSTIYAGNCLRYDVTGLQPSTDYLLRVRAFNAEGPGEFSACASLSTSSSIPSVCGAPRIQVVLPFNQGLSLIWEAANPQGSPITAYVLQMAQASAEPKNFRKVYEGLECKTIVPASNLSPDLLYCFRVQAKNKNGASGWIESQISALSVPPECPVQPTLIAPSPNTLLLTWQHPSGNNESRSYDVDLAVKEAKLNPSRLPGLTDCSVSISNLRTGCPYVCRIRTVNPGGKSPWTEWLEEWTHVGLPFSPTNLVLLSATSTSLTIRWDHEYSPHPDLTQSRISFSVDIQSATDLISIIVLSETQTTISSLLPGTQYKLRVLARNIMGSSPPSSWLQTSTLAIPPSTPTTPSVIAVSNNSAKLGWTEVPSTDSQPTLFCLDIRKAQAEAGEYSRAWTGSGLSHKLRKLQPLSIYDIRLVACNSIGESAPTASVRITTAPDPPNSITLARVESALRISWPARFSAAGVIYIVEVGVEGTWTVLFRESSSEFVFTQERARDLLGRDVSWEGFIDRRKNFDFRLRCKFGEATSEASAVTSLHPPPVAVDVDAPKRYETKAGRRKTSTPSASPTFSSSSVPGSSPILFSSLSNSSTSSSASFMSLSSSSCSSSPSSSNYSSFSSSSSDSVSSTMRIKKRNRGHKPKKGAKQEEEEAAEKLLAEEEESQKKSCCWRLRNCRRGLLLRSISEFAKEARLARHRRKWAVGSLLTLFMITCAIYAYCLLYG